MRSRFAPFNTGMQVELVRPYLAIECRELWSARQGTGTPDISPLSPLRRIYAANRADTHLLPTG